jgi:hypothetical protein
LVNRSAVELDELLEELSLEPKAKTGAGAATARSKVRAAAYRRKAVIWEVS